MFIKEIKMWLRARCKEKKELRNQEIIESCLELYKTTKFEDITISKIAKHAKWTRSNFYKYYQTKEEAFLDVILMLFEDWEKTLIENLKIKKEMTPYTFSTLWLESYEKNHIFTTLLGLMGTLIEEHSSLEKVVEFKKHLFVKMDDLSLVIKDITGSEEEDIKKFIIAQAALIQGGYHYFKMSDFKKEVLSKIDHSFNHNEAKEVIVESLEVISKKYLFKNFK